MHVSRRESLITKGCDTILKWTRQICVSERRKVFPQVWSVGVMLHLLPHEIFLGENRARLRQYKKNVMLSWVGLRTIKFINQCSVTTWEHVMEQAFRKPPLREVTRIVCYFFSISESCWTKPSHVSGKFRKWVLFVTVAFAWGYCTFKLKKDEIFGFFINLRLFSWIRGLLG